MRGSSSWVLFWGLGHFQRSACKAWPVKQTARLWTLTAASSPLCCIACCTAVLLPVLPGSSEFCLTMPTGGGGPCPGPPGWAPPLPQRAHPLAPPACPAGPTSPTYSPTSPQHCKLCVGRCRGAHSRPVARSGLALHTLTLPSTPLMLPSVCPLPCSAYKPAILWVLFILELPGEHIGFPGGGAGSGRAGCWWEGQGCVD